MLTDLQRDILIKSAEGIQEGMWCVGEWFASSPNEEDENWQNVLSDEVFDDGKTVLGNAQIEKLSGMYRCAEGELMLRTVILGGTQSDYEAVENAVSGVITEHCDRCASRGERGTFDIFDHNDTCMFDLDPFTAGQQWADIFCSLL